MRFQEVAGTAHGIVGIAYHATRTRLLLRLRLRLMLNRSGPARAGVALIAAVVAGATAEHGQQRRRGQDEKCMSHVQCFLPPAC